MPINRQEVLMQVLYMRCAGLDVHKDTIVACVRCVSPPMHQEVRSFGTTTTQSPRVFRLSTRASCEPISRSTLPAPGCDAPPVRGIGTKTCLARPFLTS